MQPVDGGLRHHHNNDINVADHHHHGDDQSTLIHQHNGDGDHDHTSDFIDEHYPAFVDYGPADHDHTG